jgi:hypothetical protein
LPVFKLGLDLNCRLCGARACIANPADYPEASRAS